MWDTYTPPTFVDGVFTSGTGFGATDDSGALVDYGYQFILRMANPGGGSDAWHQVARLGHDCQFAER